MKALLTLVFALLFTGTLTSQSDSIEFFARERSTAMLAQAGISEKTLDFTVQTSFKFTPVPVEYFGESSNEKHSAEVFHYTNGITEYYFEVFSDSSRDFVSYWFLFGARLISFEITEAYFDGFKRTDDVYIYDRRKGKDQEISHQKIMSYGEYWEHRYPKKEITKTEILTKLKSSTL